MIKIGAFFSDEVSNLPKFKETYQSISLGSMKHKVVYMTIQELPTNKADPNQ